jgi:hypothetical protein
VGLYSWTVKWIQDFNFGGGEPYYELGGKQSVEYCKNLKHEARGVQNTGTRFSG